MRIFVQQKGARFSQPVWIQTDLLRRNIKRKPTTIEFVEISFGIRLNFRFWASNRMYITCGLCTIIVNTLAIQILETERYAIWDCYTLCWSNRLPFNFVSDEAFESGLLPAGWRTQVGWNTNISLFAPFKNIIIFGWFWPHGYGIPPRPFRSVIIVSKQTQRYLLGFQKLHGYHKFSP